MSHVSARPESSALYDGIMPDEMASLAHLIADTTRAQLLLSLLDGRARTGTELARHVGVTRSTVSEHLGLLLDAGMVRVQAQGRHRYWRLRNAHVASLLESLAVAASQLECTPPDAPRAPRSLTTARSCYDHLAGRLGVAIFDRLCANGDLVHEEGAVSVSDQGTRRFRTLGIDTEAIGVPGRPLARACLDWTERTDHLAGPLGSALFTRLLDNSWIRHGDQPRRIEVTRSGRTMLLTEFDWSG